MAPSFTGRTLGSDVSAALKPEAERAHSDQSRANPVESAFQLVEAGFRSVKIELSLERCLGPVTVWEGGV